MGHDGRGAAFRLWSLILAERDRWFLWSPVALGSGIALYFALPVEPPPWPAVLVAATSALAALLLRRRGNAVVLLIGLALLAAGFAVAQQRVRALDGPVLGREVGPGTVEGRIVAVEQRDHGAVRLLLDHPSIEGVAPAATPERVRVTVRAKDRPALAPGEWVDLWAVLAPPAGPVAPGAFDFAREAYFDRVGASGYALGAPRLIASPPKAPHGGFALWLNGLRQRLAERITAAREGPEGAVAAALLVGERGAIPEESLAAMRDAGLAHLLAISGLHVGLVAGLIFLAVRALLAAIEPVALRYPIKKWAAFVTILAAFAYLLVSGASVPTQRAFLMTGVVLFAVMLDRTSISLRLIAWAAIAVLIAAPESLLGPSFQMSFAAATALIAAYEMARGPLARWQARARFGTRPLIYLAGVALTTLVAGLATAPFAAFHFNRVADYGLIANLAAVPVTAFWVMPWGIAVFLFMPFGAEWLALVPMGWGIGAILWVARGVASLEGAVSLVPAMPNAALLLMVAGGLWLCLWRRRWRLLGVGAFVAGVALAPLADKPDILVDGEGKLFGVASADGSLALSSKRRARFEAELWLRRRGAAEAAPWPEEGESADGRLACDAHGCIYRANGRTAALVYDESALEEDCRAADVVVSLVPVKPRCPADVVVDRFDLWREGAYAVWLGGKAVRVESVAEAQGARPWTIRRGGVSEEEEP